MSKVKFHASQLKVLEPKDTNELVSASAGSGKTTIMVQKIADMLISGQVAPSEIMVVTFTIAAADEMKSRLNAKVEEYAESHPEDSTKLAVIKDGLLSASIGTIHSICLRTIKKYFYALGINANVQVVEGARDVYLRNLSFNQALKDMDKSALTDLIEIFSDNRRDYGVLFEAVEGVYNFVATLPNQEEYLSNAIQNYQDETKIVDYLLDNIKDKTNETLRLISVCDLAGNDKLVTMQESVSADMRALLDCTELDKALALLNKINDYSFQGVRNAKEIVDYATFSNIINNFKNKIIKKYLEIKILNNQEKSKIIKNITNFIEIVKKFGKYFEKNKQKSNVLDFNDIEIKMLELLKNEQFVDDLRAQYKYIFVDEFQDVNSVQGEIVSRISSGRNLFLVGDVKQSIYGFRFANPEQFVGLYNDYKSDADLGVAEEMNVNYRTNPKVLLFVNQVFNKIMTQERGGIDYQSTSQFEPMRDDFPCPDKVNIDILLDESSHKPAEQSLPVYSVKADTNFESKVTTAMLSAKYVANKITKLIHTQIYDSKTKQMRQVNFGDICVLSRKLDSQRVRELVSQLQSQNIPVTIDQTTDITACEGLQVLLSVMKVISYSTADVDWIVYLSSIGDMTFEDMSAIAKVEGESYFDKIHNYTQDDDLKAKLDTALTTLADMRKNIVNKSVLQIFEMLLYKYHLYLYIANTPNGMQEVALVEDFLMNMTEEEKCQSLADYLMGLDSNSDRQNKSTFSTSANSVRIQTIHKSKGLEYPIVILIDAGAEYSSASTKKRVVCDLNLGMGIDYYDESERTKAKTMQRVACETCVLEREANEELRLLYVAMTRAQNQLHIVGSCDDKLFESAKIEGANSYLENILAVFGGVASSVTDTESEYAKVHIVTPEECEYNEAEIVEERVDIDFDEMLDRNLNFEYDGVAEQISLKNSITQITKQLVEDAFVPNKLLTSESLGGRAESPELGTAYHKALQDCMCVDQAECYARIYAYETDLDKTLLKKCYDVLSMLLDSCVKMTTESQFMMNVPYNVIVPTSRTTDKVLVQGVVDLIIEEPDGLIVVDYKYSNSSPQSLKKRYSPQVNLYAMACEKAYHKPINAKYIYSIKSGQLIEI